jgi:hypothetical protein
MSQAEVNSVSMLRSKMSQAISIPRLEQGPSSPATSLSSSSYPHTPTYSGPGLAPNNALIPPGVSQSPPHSRTTHIISNPTPADSSDDQSPSDQPPSDQSRPPRRKGTNRPAPPPTPAAPRLHEDGGVRLEGGRLNDPEAMIDVPPIYREY